MPGKTLSRHRGIQDGVTALKLKLHQESSRSKGHGIGLGVVALNRDGIAEVVFSHGVGPSDTRSSKPYGDRTRGRVASVTKLFNSLSIHQLAAEGRIELDRPVEQYLPDVQLADPRWSKVTVRHLLAHLSGLPFTLPSQELFSMWGLKREVLGGYPEALADLSKVRLISAPGTRASYSNIGYALLGMIIARCHGARAGDERIFFEQFQHSRLLGPLGMNDSSFGGHHETMDLAMPVSAAFPVEGGHARFRLTTMADLGFSEGAAGLISTVADLNHAAGWGLQMVSEEGAPPVEGPFIKPEVVQAAQSLPEQRPAELPWGQGFHILQFLSGRGSRAVGHKGGWPGFRSMLALLPDEQMGIVVTANAWSRDPDLLGRLAHDALAEPIAQARGAQRKPRRQQVIEVPDVLSPVEVRVPPGSNLRPAKATEFRKWLTTYRSLFDKAALFSLDDDQMMFSWQAGEVMPVFQDPRGALILDPRSGCELAGSRLLLTSFDGRPAIQAEGAFLFVHQDKVQQFGFERADRYDRGRPPAS